MSSSSYTGIGISLAGTWECGACGARGDGWYDPDDGLTLHDEHGDPFVADDHDCEAS
ncbi:hypothetical protein ACMA1D_02095 [Streptomyces sp. 796.1]|uniref:hypothetical protein n=1 Tax=Streptomyces sp. 796.1 TaxID=3163029 RepID=UPI0039C984D2